MKISVKNSLFWYLKDRTKLDLEDPSHIDLYVQQVLTHGKTSDVKELLKTLTFKVFKESFKRIKNFLPKEVRMFWEDGLGDIGEHSGRNLK